ARRGARWLSCIGAMRPGLSEYSAAGGATIGRLAGGANCPCMPLGGPYNPLNLVDGGDERLAPRPAEGVKAGANIGISPFAAKSGCSSVGRAQRCQRCCRGFESHHPLFIVLEPATGASSWPFCPLDPE